MNAYFEAVSIIIIAGVRDLHIRYSSDFITSWKDRTSYFPFEDLMKSNTQTIIDGKEVANIKKGKLKKQKTFRDIIQYEDKEKILKRLHQLIDGKKGKDVGVILFKCVKEKVITRLPTQKEYETEFTLNGTWRNISLYMKGDKQVVQDAAKNINLDIG